LYFWPDIFSSVWKCQMDHRCQAVAQMLIHTWWPGVSEINVVLYACRSWCCSLSSSLWQWPVLLAIISGCHEIMFVTGTLAFLVSVSVQCFHIPHRIGLLFLPSIKLSSRGPTLSIVTFTTNCLYYYSLLLSGILIGLSAGVLFGSQQWLLTMTTYIEWMFQWSLAHLIGTAVSCVFSFV